MVEDIFAKNPHLFLGSRLKRMGERLQSDVLRLFEQAGMPIQPGQAGLLAALHEYGPLMVGDLVAATGISQPGVTRTLARLVAMGLVEPAHNAGDQRLKLVQLTAAGAATVARCKHDVWPHIEAAVGDICAGLTGPLVGQLRAVEQALEASPLDRRATRLRDNGLTIRPFSDQYAHLFRDISLVWIKALFTVEQTDLDVLNDPYGQIIARGGDILFVEAAGLGVVGTCALQKTGDAQYELTKLGVLPQARGRGAGLFLLNATIRRAQALAARRLYLLSNRQNQTAINMFEASGFVHDEGIMREFGARYKRCNVAMLYKPA